MTAALGDSQKTVALVQERSDDRRASHIDITAFFPL
jgi:hypothetical protein